MISSRGNKRGAERGWGVMLKKKEQGLRLCTAPNFILELSTRSRTFQKFPFLSSFTFYTANTTGSGHRFVSTAICKENYRLLLLYATHQPSRRSHNLYL